jgi:steroid delta-isomerase-like uncharacterized protein
MRRFTQALVALVLAGCSSSEQQPQVVDNEAPPAATDAAPAESPPAASAAPAQPPPKRPMAELIKESTNAAEAAWAAKDMKKLLALYAPDAKLVSFGQAGTKEVGISTMQQELEGLWKGMSEVKLKSARVFQSGSVAVVEWVVAGKTTDAKPIGLAGVSVMTFADDGKIQREHLYMDDQTIGMQMGAKGLKGRQPVALPAATEWLTAGTADADKKSLDAAKALYAAIDKRDMKTFESAMTDDAVFMDLARPEDIKGKAKVKADLGNFIKAFPDLKLEPKQEIAAGKYVVVEGTWTGTMKGQLGPLKASNKSGTVHFVDVLEIKDGKVAKITTYANSAEFAAAFLPPPPAPKDGGKKPEAGSTDPKKGSDPKSAPPAKDPAKEPAKSQQPPPKK